MQTPLHNRMHPNCYNIFASKPPSHGKEGLKSKLVQHADTLALKSRFITHYLQNVVVEDLKGPLVSSNIPPKYMQIGVIGV